MFLVWPPPSCEAFLVVTLPVSYSTLSLTYAFEVDFPAPMPWSPPFLVGFTDWFLTSELDLKPVLLGAMKLTLSWLPSLTD